MSASHDATMILADLGRGDASAADRLLPLVYDELRTLAAKYFRGEPQDHTLQPTAVVHEAFVRLINQPNSEWNNRAHFFAVAATAMRHILVDHARRRSAEKRGGGRDRVVLDDANSPAEQTGADVLALDEALKQLAELDARRHRIVEMRYFGGLTMPEIAEVLGVSLSTVEADWRGARAWLSLQLAN